MGNTTEKCNETVNLYIAVDNVRLSLKTLTKQIRYTYHLSCFIWQWLEFLLCVVFTLECNVLCQHKLDSKQLCKEHPWSFWKNMWTIFIIINIIIIEEMINIQITLHKIRKETILSTMRSTDFSKRLIIVNSTFYLLIEDRSIFM